MWVHICVPSYNIGDRVFYVTYRMYDSQHDSVPSAGASPHPPKALPSKSSEENNSSGMKIFHFYHTSVSVCMYSYVYGNKYLFMYVRMTMCIVFIHMNWMYLVSVWMYVCMSWSHNNICSNLPQRIPSRRAVVCRRREHCQSIALNRSGIYCMTRWSNNPAIFKYVYMYI